MAKKKAAAVKATPEKTTEQVADTNAESQNGGFIDAGDGTRDAILSEYAKQYENVAAIEYPDEQETEAPSETGATDDGLSEKSMTEASPEEEAAEFISEQPEDKTKEQKTVPHQAFHEERERRKALARELEESKQQLHDVLKDFNSLVESMAD